MLCSARICRFILDRLTLSWSIKSSVPIPLRASASVTYPPTPPMPKTATRDPARRSKPSRPVSNSVLENGCSMHAPFLFRLRVSKFCALFSPVSGSDSRALPAFPKPCRSDKCGFLLPVHSCPAPAASLPVPKPPQAALHVFRTVLPRLSAPASGTAVSGILSAPVPHPYQKVSSPSQ